MERVLPALLVLAPPAAAFIVPFLGPAVGLLTPVIAGAVGPNVWPVRRWVAAVMGVGVLVSLWVVLVMLTFRWLDGDVVAFLLVPLCAPTGTAPFVVPPLTAVATYATVAGLSVRLRAIWLWPIAAAAGAGAFCATWVVLERGDVRWIC